MAVKNKKKKAQMLILKEIKKQLILQAERWGLQGYYTPLKLEEMELEACVRIKSDFLAEKTNLSYELQIDEERKREIEIKISRIDMYLRKADRVIEQHNRNIARILDKKIGDRKKTMYALDRLKFSNHGVVSVMIRER